MDPDIIADKFATYFTTCYSCNSANQKDLLKNEFTKLRDRYSDFPSSDILFDTEIVSNIILELKRGKAGDIEGLSNEHLIFSHHGCLRGTVVERRSLTCELSLSCARPAADG